MPPQWDERASCPLALCQLVLSQQRSPAGARSQCHVPSSGVPQLGPSLVQPYERILQLSEQKQPRPPFPPAPGSLGNHAHLASHAWSREVTTRGLGSAVLDGLVTFQHLHNFYSTSAQPPITVYLNTSPTVTFRAVAPTCTLCALCAPSATRCYHVAFSSPLK